MIIKITKAGVLEIKRKNLFESTNCPFSGASCNHDCALFGEPYKADCGTRVLELCNGKVLCCAKILDERE